MTSESESSSAPKRLAPFSIRAMRPSMPSSTAAIMIAASALSHSAVIAKRIAGRPEQSASAVTALGTTARSGMPRRSRCGGFMACAPLVKSLGDALERLRLADPGDDRLARDGALAEQDPRRGSGREIDVDTASEADEADPLA